MASMKTNSIMNGKQGLEDYRGRWKRISDTVKKLGAFSHVPRRRQSSNSLEGIEAKFYSDETKRRLSKQSSQSLLQHAPYYSRPSEQADSLGDLSQLGKGRNMHLPPLTSDEARDIEKQALQKRIRRKRSVIFSNSNPHLNVLACGSHSVSPRTLTDEERLRLRMKFKGLVRVFLAFKRIWLYHKGRVDEILQTFKGLDSLVKTPVDESELLFNVAYFKAKRQSVISSDLKKILSKHPTMRTPQDIHSLIVMMGNYPTLAEYPMVMQRMIAQRAWYEWYDAKRVIVREGHVAYSFFYILSGSAVMTMFDHQSKESKTAKFVSRGDSFGDSCLMNGSARECTTISKEFIELLVLRDEDFAEIFMSGGLKQNTDSFLEGLSYMEGFPIERLLSSSSRAVFTYFKRGSVIVNDSTTSDCIYIIKSGHCTVLKKLQSKDPTSIDSLLIAGKLPAPKDETLRRSPESTASHEMRRLDRKLERITSKVTSNKDIVQKLNFYDPSINVPMNGLLDKLRGIRRPLPPISSFPLTSEHLGVGETDEKLSATSDVSGANGTPIDGDTEARDPIDQNSAKLYSHLEEVEKVEEDGLDPTDIDLCIAEIEQAQSGPTPKSATLPFRTKGPYFRPPVSTTLEDITEEQGETTLEEVDTQTGGSDRSSISSKFSGFSRSHATTPSADMHQAKAQKSDVFITVQTLKPGAHFGLIQAIAENIKHPTLSLVSHGAECVVLHKKFFMEAAPLKLLDKLREQLFPYPSDEKLQENLEISLYWKYHKHDVITNQLVTLKQRQRHRHSL